MKIAIIGAGNFGIALGDILTKNNHDVSYYDKNNDYDDFDEAIDGASFILIAVPSDAVESVLVMLPTDIPLIVATKGLLNANLFNSFNDYMVLSGPSFADDLKAEKPTRLTSTDERIDALLKTNYLEFDHTSDINGVLLCGALKNIYAICAGFKGVKKGTPSWDSYIRESILEMKNILSANGSMAETVELACGIDDLKLTCAYPSRNYEFGDRLRRDESYKPEKTVEGISALKRINDGEIIVPKNATLLRELLVLGRDLGLFSVKR